MFALLIIAGFSTGIYLGLKKKYAQKSISVR